MKLVSVSEMKTIEQAANKRGISYQQMMQNAGVSLARFIIANFNPENRSVLGLVGNGNNGGDTLVALAAMAKSGWQAYAYIVKQRPANDPMSEWLRQVGGSIIQATADKDRSKLNEWLANSSLLLDGVLGTGVKLPMKQDIGDVLSLAGQARGRLYIIAVDCPSGVDCESGQAASQTIPADMTYTMAAVKKGLLRFPAAQFVGRIEVGDIGLPDDFKELKEIKHSVIFKQDVRSAMPRRPRDAHKGTFGTAMIVAGSVNYIGATQLAGTAAYRSGVGLVRMGVIERVQSALSGSMIESTWLLLPDEDGAITEDAASVVFENLDKATALLIGPGLGTDDRTYKFIEKLFAMEKGKKKGKQIGFIVEEQKQSEALQRNLPPLVIDADALNLLARIENWPAKLPRECILTPHPGEMARLTGISVEEIQRNRCDVAGKYAAKWKQVVILKGAFTVIAHPDGRTATIPIATAALAKGGTGDILAGLVCGFLAQGMESFPAAWSAAWIHAQAGIRAAEDLGSDTAVMAWDVMNALPKIFRGLSR